MSILGIISMAFRPIPRDPAEATIERLSLRRPVRLDDGSRARASSPPTRKPTDDSPRARTDAIRSVLPRTTGAKPLFVRPKSRRRSSLSPVDYYSLWTWWRGSLAIS